MVAVPVPDLWRSKVVSNPGNSSRVQVSPRHYAQYRMSIYQKKRLAKLYPAYWAWVPAGAAGQDTVFAILHMVVYVVQHARAHYYAYGNVRIAINAQLHQKMQASIHMHSFKGV